MGSALSTISRNIQVLNSKKLLALNSKVFGGGALRDFGGAIMSDFRYKRYPPEISGYITDTYKLQLKIPTQIYSALSFD